MPFYPLFFGGGFPYKNRLQKKGTLILASLLEDLDVLWAALPVRPMSERFGALRLATGQDRASAEVDGLADACARAASAPGQAGCSNLGLNSPKRIELWTCGFLVLVHNTWWLSAIRFLNFLVF